MSHLHRAEETPNASYSVDPNETLLNEIGRFKLLTPEQMYENSVIIQAGLTLLSAQYNVDIDDKFSLGMLKDQIQFDEIELQTEHVELIHTAIEARDAMLCANQRLVVSIAKRYIGRGVKLNDLIQEGIVGLDKAVHQFDPQKGFRFSTYATSWIKQAVQRASPQGEAIRIPHHIRDRYESYTRLVDSYISTNRPYTIEDIAAHMGITVAQACQLRELPETVMGVASLQSKFGEYDAELEDFVVDPSERPVEDEAMKRSDSDVVLESLQELTELQQQIVRMRYGIGCQPMTVREIARDLCVTDTAVHRVDLSARRRLKHSTVLQELVRD